MKRKLVFFSGSLLVLVWLVNTSRPGTRIEGCFQGCAASGESDHQEIRVISLNILHGFPRFEYLPRRLEGIAAEIARLNPDIVLLQEVPWTTKTGNAARFLASQTAMNYAYLRANGNRWAILFEEGEAILSRYPLTALDFVELRPRAGLFEHRVALHAAARTRAGDIDLYVTHLTNGAADVNAAQAQTLQTFVEGSRGRYALIGGDFNASPNSPQIEALAKSWVDAGRSNPTFTCCVESLTGLAEDPYTERIDYVFLSGNLVARDVLRVFDRPLETDEGWLRLSDHAGVSVDMIVVR